MFSSQLSFILFLLFFRSLPICVCMFVCVPACLSVCPCTRATCVILFGFRQILITFIRGSPTPLLNLQGHKVILRSPAVESSPHLITKLCIKHLYNYQCYRNNHNTTRYQITRFPEMLRKSYSHSECTDYVSLGVRYILVRALSFSCVHFWRSCVSYTLIVVRPRLLVFLHPLCL